MPTNKGPRLSSIKKSLIEKTALEPIGSIGQDATIKVTGIQFVENNSENIDIITRGKYIIANNEYFINYYEDIPDSMEGSNVEIVYYPLQNKVCMVRSGQTNADLTIEKNRRHICKYGTPYGLILLGITCSDISSSLQASGGQLMFEYCLDINSALVSVNKVNIMVLPDSTEK